MKYIYITQLVVSQFPTSLRTLLSFAYFPRNCLETWALNRRHNSSE